MKRRSFFAWLTGLFFAPFVRDPKADEPVEFFAWLLYNNLYLVYRYLDKEFDERIGICVPCEPQHWVDVCCEYEEGHLYYIKESIRGKSKIDAVRRFFERVTKNGWFIIPDKDFSFENYKKIIPPDSLYLDESRIECMKISGT